GHGERHRGAAQLAGHVVDEGAFGHCETAQAAEHDLLGRVGGPFVGGDRGQPVQVERGGGQQFDGGGGPGVVAGAQLVQEVGQVVGGARGGFGEPVARFGQSAFDLGEFAQSEQRGQRIVELGGASRDGATRI